ncbi:MAG: SUMF1/EgtB/PvdO family nonheme iron enzyme [Polyangiaceae bacterium]|nr:SUMF1/EgtB/PvdO family nonheme iron enzyme [Polyangiaceae bacterium]
MTRPSLALVLRLIGWCGAAGVAGSLAGCARGADQERASPATSAPSAAPATSSAAPAGALSAAPATSSAAPTGARAAAPATCPAGMRSIPGGAFRVGSAAGVGASEESPRFETEVASFCLDETEVTVAAYAACVAAKRCTPARDTRRFCNARYPERGEHPVNCVDFSDAAGYCGWRGARLPTEVEWEYAARGGAEYRNFSWGNEAPDGRTCWKHPGGSCKVRSYAPGAFGLYDMTGNVWEWTGDWFGTYPWPPVHGLTRVYRGGSWSRRFDKWMSTKLRNRFRPREWGSHLGMRCALTLPSTECPFGRTGDGSRCELGVVRADCPAGEAWNGVRCASKDAPRCPKAQHEAPGHGCVLDVDVAGALPGVDLSGVSSARAPGFDADCQKYYPGRPHAYSYAGGTHAARNLVSGRAGCKNRDVGVGWNSTCCP